MDSPTSIPLSDSPAVASGATPLPVRSVAGRGRSPDGGFGLPCILLLEDDPDLRRKFARRLRSEGLAVDEVATLAEVRAALAARTYRCLVLDRMVPDGDALDLVVEWRGRPHLPPVLILSALGSVGHRVVGLANGSDDYLSKPVQLRELALRVQNLMAKAVPSERSLVRLGEVEIDRELCQVTVAGEDIDLSPLQCSVLDYLVAHRARMVPTEELLEHCWDGERPMFTNPLHSQVTRLRLALGDRLRIDSVRGAGYVLRVGEAEEPLEGQRRWTGSA